MSKIKIYFRFRKAASVRPRTISDLKKIQNYVKTTNAKGELQE